MRGRLGPRRGDTREIRVLNRYIRWPVHGDPEYEADPRHAQLIIEVLNSTSPKKLIVQSSNVTLIMTVNLIVL